MDGGSSPNIHYADTLNKMKILRSSLHPSKASFYGVIPGKEAVLLECIRLHITFSRPDNFRKWPLTFEVVDFPSIYHAFLGRPCFAKLMAVPNYTYLKLKMPIPKEVITIRATFQQAEYYGQDCIALVTAIYVFLDPASSNSDSEEALGGKKAKAVVSLDRPSSDKALGTTCGNSGLASPLGARVRRRN
jgi:hypothetical protein